MAPSQACQVAKARRMRSDGIGRSGMRREARARRRPARTPAPPSHEKRTFEIRPASCTRERRGNVVIRQGGSETDDIRHQPGRQHSVGPRRAIDTSGWRDYQFGMTPKYEGKISMSKRSMAAVVCVLLSAINGVAAEPRRPLVAERPVLRPTQSGTPKSRQELPREPTVSVASMRAEVRLLGPVKLAPAAPVAWSADLNAGQLYFVQSPSLWISSGVYGLEYVSILGHPGFLGGIAEWLAGKPGHLQFSLNGLTPSSAYILNCTFRFGVTGPAYKPEVPVTIVIGNQTTTVSTDKVHGSTGTIAFIAPPNGSAQVDVSLRYNKTNWDWDGCKFATAS